MSESLSMQHGLSTSKLSSQVRPPQPGILRIPGNSWDDVCVSERPLVFTERLTITPTSSHSEVTTNMLQIIDLLLDLYSSIIQTSFILWPHLVVMILSLPFDLPWLLTLVHAGVFYNPSSYISLQFSSSYNNKSFFSNHLTDLVFTDSWTFFPHLYLNFHF